MEFGENTVKNRQTQVLSLFSQNDCRLILSAAVPLLACERRLISGRRFSPPEKVERRRPPLGSLSRFKPQPDQHLGSLNNWEESAAFVITSANG